ncbi:hypothetical protein H4217_007366, partial [Coemansia sp. RSA 1939]
MAEGSVELIDILSQSVAEMANVWIIAQRIGWKFLIPIAISVIHHTLSHAVRLKIERMRKESKRRVLPDFRKNIFWFHNNIRSIKFFGWEETFRSLSYRVDEKPYVPPFIWRLLSWCVNMVGSATYQLSAAVTITLHLGTAGHTGYTDIALLTDSIASLTLISRIAAKAAQNCVKVRKCYELVEELLQPDSKRFVKNNSSSPNSKISVKLDNCGFSWGAEKFSISSTSLTVNAGELVMIVGRIGSGKSSFVSALCGEMQITGGSGKVNGSIGYVEQKPTILNDTLRENVLMGQDFDEAFFWQVMEACDLTQDLQAMSDGDLTKVGSFGLKLSGGQKMRLALA